MCAAILAVMENIRIAVIQYIDDFLEQSGMSGRQFGILAGLNENFYRRLKNGDGMTLGSLERAQDYIAGYGHLQNQE
jgi:hypothetical protein